VSVEGFYYEVRLSFEKLLKMFAKECGAISFLVGITVEGAVRTKT
jgi:hypothetical protein